MERGIIHDYNLSSFESGSQTIFQPRLKYRSIAGSFKGIAELSSFGYKALQSYLLYPHVAPI
jgi:hypothetical protein